jgi:putative hydrolase of the HAD superfamily
MTPDLNAVGDLTAQKEVSKIDSTGNEAVWQTLRREVKAISLDLWGTILDDKQAPSDTILYSESRQNFLREELQRCGYDVSPEQMRAAYKRAWQYFDDLWAKQIAFGSGEGLREMLRYLNAELPKESFERVRQYFEEAYQDPQPMDGALEAVQQLAENYPLALISDTAWTPGRVLRQIFARYKILGCFRALIFSGEVGQTKPHPQMFNLALAGLGVQPQACLHIGDLQHTDIAGAKAAGMRSAWLRRPVYAGNEQHDHGPEVVVKSVREVAEKLLES